jgi:hypothetical protein
VIRTVQDLLDALAGHDPNAVVLGCYNAAYPLTAGLAAATEIETTEGNPLGGAPVAVFISFIEPPDGVGQRTTLASWGESAPTPPGPPPPPGG